MTTMGPSPFPNPESDHKKRYGQPSMITQFVLCALPTYYIILQFLTEEYVERAVDEAVDEADLVFVCIDLLCYCELSLRAKCRLHELAYALSEGRG